MVARRFLLLGTLCMAALAGCAHSEQAKGYWGKAEPSGFLNDYSKLRPAADDTEATLVYFTGDKAKFKSYTKVWIEPVQVWRGEKSDAKDMDVEDAHYLSQFLWSKLDEEFRKNYQMVRSPGPDVIRTSVSALPKPVKTFRWWITSLPCIRPPMCYPKRSNMSPAPSRLSASRRLKWKRPTVRPVKCWLPESIAGEAANISGSRCIGGAMWKRPIPIGPRSMPGGLA